MNVSKLRKLVYGTFESQVAFARKLNWHKNKVNALLTGKYTPAIDEVSDIAEALDLDLDACGSIFLPEISRNCDKSA